LTAFTEFAKIVMGLAINDLSIAIINGDFIEVKP
jgi:hypothetical protein